MALPFISNFGDEDHEKGETGLVIDGFELGFFAGEAWMYQNADRTGNADQLTVTAWSDLSLTGVAIPAAPNNALGTVYLFIKRFGDNAWSLSYTFTLSAAAVTAPTVDAGGPYSNVGAGVGIQLNATVTPGSDPAPTNKWSVQSGGAGSFDDDTLEDPIFTPDTTTASVLLLTVAPSDTGDVTDTAQLTAVAEAEAPSVPTQEGGAWGHRSSRLRQKERRQLKREDDEIIAIIQQLAPDIMQHHRRLH